MYPAATLFLDVCVQNDLWPDGPWPLIDAVYAANVVRVFAVARASGVRQGGIVCRHDATGIAAPPGVPPHCGGAVSIDARPEGCRPVLPISVGGTLMDPGGAYDTAVYVETGCAARPDTTSAHARAFAHLVAGVRDAVVFGAGIEHGFVHAVDALLARRIRTHVVLDAAGTADDVAAQAVVATWKRRGVDGTTTAMLDRMLGRR